MLTLRRALPRFGLPRLSQVSLRLVLRFGRAFGVARSRARLSTLDDHLLSDIGVTRDEALAEADRPVWDAPAHWYRK